MEWPRAFATSDSDREALMVLLALPSLTPRRLLALAQDHRTAGGCLAAVRAGRAGSDLDRDVATSTEGSAVRARSAAAGARLVAVHDQEYPPGLLDLFDPPAGLFVRGRSLGEPSQRVAVVGARNCSDAGKEVATMIGAGLAQAGVCVVSGGARGIDASAHQGALQSAGSTIAVLGCGIDVLYPGQNRRLLARIAEEGSLVSEYAPGVRAEPFRFPARNRIVAALARAVVVVEGAAGSGSMITAEHALDIGREVLAVPGAVNSELSHAPNSLIRDGARLVRGVRDLINDLRIASPGPDDKLGSESDPSNDRPSSVQPGLNPVEQVVWAALQGPTPADRLAQVTGLDLPLIVSALVGLELRGLVLQAGGRYQRHPRSMGSS